MNEELKKIECVLAILFTHSLSSNPSVSADAQHADELVNRAQYLAEEVIKRYEPILTEIQKEV